MAGIVESVVSSVLTKLGDRLLQEASSLLGVGDQLEWVKSQFGWMQAFLKDAEAKSDKDERVKQWMREVRDVSYLAEDIIDAFLVEVAPLIRRRGFSGAVKRCGSIFTEIHARGDLVSKIEKMKEKISSIQQSRVTYGIQDIGGLEQGASSASAVQSLTERRRLSSPYVEQPDLVGFQTDLETLIQQLTQGEPRRSVISIVGMGGLGKTTLARKLYQTDAVIRHFDHCIWITVSQAYEERELLGVVMKRCMALSGQLENDAVELCSKIAEHLRGKTYLVVLDDVWTSDVWDALKDAFPDSNNGSRVLLTTRNKEVALCADARSQPHELRFLNDDESWELFLKKVSSGHETNLPYVVDAESQLREEILSKCQGLPLAVVVVGGLLSRRKEVREWARILKGGWRLTEGENRMSGMLALSYRDLPYYLKPCFLYLGIFPEDSEIPAKKLIRLWAAEGFLPERGELGSEEMGEECLHELIQRSMIQVSATSSSGAVKSCRVHDLLRELALSEAYQDGFLQLQRYSWNRKSLDTPISTSSSACSSSRRLAICYEDRFDYSSNYTPPSLRSLLIHRNHNFMRLDSREKKLAFGSFKLLRVLDMKGVDRTKLPSEIGGLIHLRYLGYDCFRFESFPSNIGNLVNLETLSIRSATNMRWVQPIPLSVGKRMQQLRHIKAKGQGFWIEIKWELPSSGSSSDSSSLQSLANVVAGEWMMDDDGGLFMGRFAELRELGINIDPIKASIETAWKWIMRLKSLESLYVYTEGILGPMPPLNQHLPKLWKLKLNGRLTENHLSSVFLELPRNLTKLTLQQSHFEKDPLPVLETLENLCILELDHAYAGERMACRAGGFPRLQTLHLISLDNLREWRVEKGSMPCLSRLKIAWCSQLDEVPEDLLHMSNLKTLSLFSTNFGFNNRIRGEDWYKIQHIPTVIDDVW